MPTYLGQLGSMVEMPCLSDLEVSGEVVDEVRHDIEGTPYLTRVGPGTEWRTWSCSIGIRDAHEIARLRELTLWSRGPYRMVACDAANTNVLTPRQSVYFYGWTGDGPIGAGGPIWSSWSRGTQWTRQADGSWTTTDPTVTRSTGGAVSIPPDQVAPLGGGAYLLRGMETTTASLPGHVRVDPAVAYVSPLTPVMPGMPVTGSLYVNGGRIWLRWRDAASDVISSSSAVKDAPGGSGTSLRRLSVTRTPPAGAASVELIVDGASRMARAAIAWTPAASEWVEGRGARAVVLSPVASSLLWAADPDRVYMGADYTVREVAAA